MDSEAVSSAKSFTVKSISFLVLSSNKYSIILSFGLKGFKSSNPKDFTAIFIFSSSEIPRERSCLFKKKSPASSMACNGIKPINSEPVTRKPLAVALLIVSSKALCIEVMLILVKLYEICAIPYSSIYQPIPFTALSLPGVLTVLPSLSITFFPVIGFPSRFARPFSLISKAMALALRVEVVFKLTLYATKKSRADMAIAPVCAT